jgi:hypothetical protein
MAFDIANFQPVGGQGKRGKASQRWSYWTLDAHTTVDGSGYFNGGTANGGAYNLLEVGDIIDVVVWATAIGSGGTISTYGPHIVMTKSAGTIDVSNVTTGTVTNSD